MGSDLEANRIPYDITLIYFAVLPPINGRTYLQDGIENFGIRPSVIRIQMEAVGVFLEVRMKNDAVIKGKFCVLTCVLTFGLQVLSRLCTSFL